MNSKMKRYTEQGIWEGAQNFQACDSPHKSLTLLVPPHVHQLGSSLNPRLWGFLWELQHVGVIDRELSLPYHFLSQRTRGQVESSKLLSMGLAFW